MTTTYSAPARIDLSGGATDWCGLHTLAMAINLRASAKVTKLISTDEIEINIGDISEKYITPTYGTQTDLFKAVIELSGVHGIKVEYETDIPKGSGLGGSAPLTVSTLFAINELFNKNWTKYYIAELAQRAETYKLQTVNGYQDQYTATFGGLIFMDFNGKECQLGNYSKTVEEEPYAVVEDLNDFMPDFHILVAVPEISRKGSDETNSSVSQRYLTGDKIIRELMFKKAALTKEAKKLIIEKNVNKLYEVIEQNNVIMREFGFLSEDNEAIIAEAKRFPGVLATKTTGAGRGAVAIFTEDENTRIRLFDHLQKFEFIKNLFKVEKDNGARKEKI